MLVHFKTQAQNRVLLFDEALTKTSVEYSDYNNVCLVKNAIELLENTRINEHVIKLEEGKQLLFGPIYSLKLVELETLKTYIEINLANDFIWPSKFLVRALIFFNKKLDKNFRFYINYQDLNNIIIKN